MIAVIDYGVGNLGSISNMLRKADVEAVVTSSKDEIEEADKLILPGVGAFDNGVENLKKRGLFDLINDVVKNRKTPILGVCLGMQLFGGGSEEGKLAGFGWLNAKTVRFKFDDSQRGLKIPHMGWNTIEIKKPNPLVADLGKNSRFYFVHSYHLECRYEKDVIAVTNYGYDFPSVVKKENIYGIQFHPEKSHKFGMKLLENFANRC